MKYPIDPETNLPYPPEGYRWKIETTCRNEGFRVALYSAHESSRFQIADYTGYIHGFFDGFKPQHKVTPRDFRRAAIKVLKEREKDLKNKATGEQARSRFVGTYPPKKLG